MNDIKKAFEEKYSPDQTKRYVKQHADQNTFPYKPLILVLSCALVGMFAYNFMPSGYSMMASRSTSDGTMSDEASSDFEDKDVKEYIVYDFTKSISSDEVADCPVSVELNNEYTSAYMLESSTDVVLGSVISIDSSDMKFNSAVGYTYGTLLVDQTFYGSLEADTVIQYAKPGAMMISRSDFEAAQDPELQEKLQNMHGSDDGEIYYNILVEDDIPIEAGKTYLIYLNKLENSDTYEIIGLQNGLREADVNKTDTVSLIEDASGLNILNNNTGEWESLDSYVTNNIDAYK